MCQTGAQQFISVFTHINLSAGNSNVLNKIIIVCKTNEGLPVTSRATTEVRRPNPRIFQNF